MKHLSQYFVLAAVLLMAFAIYERGGRALPPAKLFVFDTNIAKYGETLKAQHGGNFRIEIPRHGEPVGTDVAQTGN